MALSTDEDCQRKEEVAAFSIYKKYYTPTISLKSVELKSVKLNSPVVEHLDKFSRNLDDKQGTPEMYHAYMLCTCTYIYMPKLVLP